MDKAARELKIIHSSKPILENMLIMSDISLQYKMLNISVNFKIPSMIRCVGTKANIGVIWKMSDKEKPICGLIFKTL